MRKIKRFLRRAMQQALNRKRLRQISIEVQADLNLKVSPQFVLKGASGHDANYLVHAAGEPIGVLRLINSHARRALPPQHMPFHLLEDKERIHHEYQSYLNAGTLSPAPLWHTHDALLCAYLPYPSLHEEMIQNPDNVWLILCRAARAINELHQTGLTHMDISLKNMLHDTKHDHIFFIDFEYAPAKEISIETQRVYDHLRLIESTWKFIPDKLRPESSEWFDLFGKVARDDLRKCSIERIKPALTRIFLDNNFTQRIESLHNGA